MLPAQSALGHSNAQPQKMVVTVHYSPEVIAYFKATGQGWQTRMDAVLREYVNSHK